MSSLNDLNSLSDSPSTFKDWVSQFTDDDRELIIDSIINKPTTPVFEILSTLEDNPYPFGRNTLSHHRRALVRGEL